MFSDDDVNVLSLKKVYKTHKRLYLLTDYCNGGDLRELLKAKSRKIPEEQAKVLIK